MYGTLKKIFAFAGSKKGLLKKSLLFAFLSGLFSAMQFAALFVVIGALVSLVSDNRDGSIVWISLGIMAVSLIGRIITTYFSTMEQTETGYCMVAEKRIHIGDRLRYIPMGYFNKNSIGNITAIVTTTLGDVENSAARVLVSVLGGFFNSVALVIVLLIFDWRIGLVAAVGVLLYLAAAELALRKSAALSSVRQHTQESLVESVLEYIQSGCPGVQRPAVVGLGLVLAGWLSAAGLRPDFGNRFFHGVQRFGKRREYGLSAANVTLRRSPARSCLTRWIFPTQTARYWIRSALLFPKKRLRPLSALPGQVRQQCAI